MRILHVITRRQLRGAEIFASQLTSEFIRAGHSVMIVALQPGILLPCVDGVQYVDLDIDPSKRWWSYNAWKTFAGLVRKWKPDIIQANASETFKFTVISKTLFQWKALLVYRNANKVSDFIKSPLLRIINTMLSRKLDYVISVSENCRLDFIGTFHVPISRTVTIPIGTILPTEVSRSSASPVPYWISVGSLVPEKNHIGLLAIFKHYCEQGGNANLKIVGDGILKDELLKEANALGISDRILFLGYLQDVGPVMKEAIGLLLPSLIEGLPGVILESMANHVPVIAYNVGGIPEVIQHEHTGMLVLKGDESGFVDAMNNVEQKADLRIHITKNAYALCERLYSIESIAKRFLKQYDDLLHA